MPVRIDLTPEEIRAIRERLGLSQVDAGELLGGGPRAFTKYEAGTIKPSASICNLLRLLDDNSALAADLLGRKSDPISITAGTRPFEVTSEHIAALREGRFCGYVASVASRGS